MKHFFILFTLLAFLDSNAQTYPSSNINLLSVIKPGGPTGYSGCWGWYQASKNKEYALAQGQNGYLYFIDVTIPTSPIVCDSVKGKPFINREVKTYQNYCYSVAGSTGSGTVHSFQIIDMSNLPGTVTVVYSGNTYFTSAHTIWIDKSNLYCAAVGHGTVYSSMEVYSLATPTAPILLRKVEQDHPINGGVHDMYVRNDTVFASSMNQGLFVYTFNGSNFNLIGTLANYTEAGYNHSSYLTADGKTLVFCDEIPSGVSIKTADVTNLNNIIVKALFKPNNQSDFVAHNPYILGNKWALVSCYQDGLNVYNISNPSSPSLEGYFDTYPQGGFNTGNYNGDPYQGNWGAYPYFPSGNILALDMTNGAFMLQLSPTIGLKEQTKNNLSVRIQQNPASQFISYQIESNESGTYKLELNDALGKCVLKIKDELNSTSCCNTVDINEIPNGIYFFTISLKDKTYKEKIIITH